MITRAEFGKDLRERLLARAEKVLLRVVVAPHFECPVEFTGSEIVSRAEQLVSSLALAKDGDVVLLLLPHSPELFLMQIGLVLRGLIPGVLSWPTTRVDPEKYQRNLIHQLSHLPASRLITLPGLAENLGASLPYPVMGLPLEYGASYETIFPTGAVSNALEKSHQTSIRQTFPDPNALFLQFSGGTTGTQKAIVVTVEMLVEQLNQLAKVLEFTEDDTVVSWLPLYHDMGLIACYWMPLFHGAASLHMAANDWVINPELLFKYVSQYQATFCWQPNFSFAHVCIASFAGWVRRLILDSDGTRFRLRAGPGFRDHLLDDRFAIQVRIQFKKLFPRGDGAGRILFPLVLDHSQIEQ